MPDWDVLFRVAVIYGCGCVTPLLLIFLFLLASGVVTAAARNAANRFAESNPEVRE